MITNETYNCLSDVTKDWGAQKSLFIISQARSGTTILQKTCCQMLGFRNGTEHLNNRMVHKKFPNLNIPAFKLWAPTTQYSLLKSISSIFKYGWVIKDVSQQEFVYHNIEWIRKHFHILYIERPIDEVVFTNKRRKWRWKHLRGMREVLNKMKFEHTIQFHEYISDRTVLPKILTSLYGYCNDYNYMNEEFVTKRNEVLSRTIEL